jgi:excisionase family DNA binding protein
MDNRQPPLSVSETAQQLRVTEQIVRKALIRGQLKGFKIGRSWRILPESIDRLRDAAETE